MLKKKLLIAAAVMAMGPCGAFAKNVKEELITTCYFNKYAYLISDRINPTKSEFTTQKYKKDSIAKIYKYGKNDINIKFPKSELSQFGYDLQKEDGIKEYFDYTPPYHYLFRTEWHTALRSGIAVYTINLDRKGNGHLFINTSTHLLLGLAISKAEFATCIGNK